MNLPVSPDLTIRLQNPTGMRCQLLQGGQVVRHGWVSRWTDEGISVRMKSLDGLDENGEFDLQAYGHFQKIRTKVKVWAAGSPVPESAASFGAPEVHLTATGPVTWQQGTEAIRLFLPGHKVTLRQSNHLIEGTSLDAGTHGVAILLPSAPTVGSPAILRMTTPGFSATASVIVRSCVRQAKNSYRIGCELKNGSQVESTGWAEFLETALGRSAHAA